MKFLLIILVTVLFAKDIVYNSIMVHPTIALALIFLILPFIQSSIEIFSNHRIIKHLGLTTGIVPMRKLTPNFPCTHTHPLKFILFCSYWMKKSCSRWIICSRAFHQLRKQVKCKYSLFYYTLFFKKCLL